jgi:hypothetical protein
MTRHWEKVLLHSGHVGDSLKMKKENVVLKKNRQNLIENFQYGSEYPPARNKNKKFKLDYGYMKI